MNNDRVKDFEKQFAEGEIGTMTECAYGTHVAKEELEKSKKKKKDQK